MADDRVAVACMDTALHEDAYSDLVANRVENVMEQHPEENVQWRRPEMQTKT